MNYDDGNFSISADVVRGRIGLRYRAEDLMEEDARVLIDGKGSGWRCWMMGRKTRSWTANSTEIAC